jgi:ZPR1 zinc finger protein
MIIESYERSREQNELLGIGEEEDAREQQRRLKESEGMKWLEEKERREAMANRPADFAGIQSHSEPGSEFSRPAGSRFSVLRSPQSLQEITTAMTAEDLERDVVIFTVPCPQCGVDAAQRMVKINIPYFKEVIVMALVCAKCGYKNSEIKVGGAISSKGRRISLHCKRLEDLSRDVLKSETATLRIPELDFTLNQYGSMGGRFTTVEGLLTNIRKELSENPFAIGDSGERSAKENFAHFLARLESFARAKEPFTMELDDPVANCYVQSLTAPQPDPQLEIEDYVRNAEQDDELGLHDMKTDDYTLL